MPSGIDLLPVMPIYWWSTRLDIHADITAKRPILSLMSYTWRSKMYKLPAAAAVALILGAPLAFGANNALPNPADLTTQHCSYLETQMPSQAQKPYAAATTQAAEQKALSFCRQDRHKDDGPQRIAQPKAPDLFPVRP
jgi:hypothetical protein